MRQLEKIALATFGFIAFSYIISAAYFGINGYYTWRQADVYGHILGFMEFKDFAPYDQFIAGDTAIFDIPIYQYIIAQTSLLLKSDPLVTTRFVNLLFWVITAFSGYKMCRSFGRPTAGMIFIFLLATSPLILHYHSVPLSDVMAIALSFLGLQVLYKHGLNWKSVICALPYLAIATLIKSPVPFVFVVFYTTYIVLSATYKNMSLRAMLVKYAPLIATLMVTLFLALLAEQLRGFLVHKEFQKVITYGSEWYFGTWEMRTSGDFWKIVWVRFNYSATSSFGYIYPIVIAIACLIKREKHHTIITISALVAFFAGWLVFSNVYKLHDYYQLPVAVIIFISFAVSLSHILAYITDKIPTRHQKNFATIGVVMVISFSFYQTMTQNTSNDRGQMRKLLSGIEYALRDQSLLLYVVSPEPYYQYSTHFPPADPTIGGFFSTKYKTVSKEDFENNCADYIKDYSAIVATRYSECLVNNKKNASYFIEDDYIMFYLNARNILTPKLDIATRAEPVIDSTFKVYLEDDQLVYIKESCTEADAKAIFFVHIFPENITDLPEGSQQHGFENLDFDFSYHGQIIDGTCIAVRDLPSYKIKQITTGQYIPATGQRVWERVIKPDSIK